VRDEFLNESLFLGLDDAGTKIATTSVAAFAKFGLEPGQYTSARRSAQTATVLSLAKSVLHGPQYQARDCN
jgi:hypothetical protein